MFRGCQNRKHVYGVLLRFRLSVQRSTDLFYQIKSHPCERTPSSTEMQARELNLDLFAVKA